MEPSGASAALPGNSARKATELQVIPCSSCRGIFARAGAPAVVSQPSNTLASTVCVCVCVCVYVCIFTYKLGAQELTPICYHPYYRDSQKGPPILEIIIWISCFGICANNMVSLNQNQPPSGKRDPIIWL